MPMREQRRARELVGGDTVCRSVAFGRRVPADDGWRERAPQMSVLEQELVQVRGDASWMHVQYVCMYNIQGLSCSATQVASGPGKLHCGCLWDGCEWRLV